MQYFLEPVGIMTLKPSETLPFASFFDLHSLCSCPFSKCGRTTGLWTSAISAGLPLTTYEPPQEDANVQKASIIVKHQYAAVKNGIVLPAWCELVGLKQAP